MRSCRGRSGARAPYEVADEFFKVLLASPRIDDAGPQPESAVEYRAGEERLAAKLDLLQNGFVKGIDRFNVFPKLRRRKAETHDTKTLRLKDLEVLGRSQRCRQRPAS